MGRAPCCDKTKVKRGPWSPEEDIILRNYVERFGTGGNWIALPHKAGLKRCGKSCRLRWLNYLRPDIKHGGFTEEEDNIIFTLYNTIGSRWSIIASQLPGRTDNDVKNHWNTKLKKKLLAGNTSPKTSKDNFNIATNNAMHFSSTPSSSSSPFVAEVDNYYYGYSDISNMGSSRLQPAVMSLNYHQNLVPQKLVSLPRLMEVPEIGPSGDGAFTTLSSSQEVSILPPFENKYGLSSDNGVDEDDEFLMRLVGSGLPYDLLNAFDFQEIKNHEVYPNLA